MFDFVRDKKWVVQLILGAIVVTFAFFGIDAYFRGGGTGGAIAKVGDHGISQVEFSEALRRQQEQVRQYLGSQADPALLDGPELRAMVLDRLIQQRLLVEQAAREGVVIPDADLQKLLIDIPAFREGDRFSLAKYEEFLKARRRTAVQFESELRSDLMAQRLSDAYAGTAIVPAVTVDRLARLRDQKREVRWSVIAPEQFLDRVTLAPEAAQQYYDAHQDEFRIPEKARVQYLVLSPDALVSQMTVSDEEKRAYYDHNLARFQKPEERQASHILINADKSAPPEKRAAAKAKVETLLAQLKRKPDTFAELAKSESQDPGSATKGGDLGFFGRGMMVKPFEDATFGAKVGELVGPVESEFGYHIIKVTAIKPAQTTDFAQAKSRIEQELRRQKAEKRFAEAAESFTNLVYEQPDSLKPAADEFKLTIQESPWVTRSAADNPALNNPRVLAAIFSDDAVQNRRNTEAIDAGNSTLVAARVIEHQPAAMKPFADVSAEIKKNLLLKEAQKLAAQEGQAKLGKLRAGEQVSIAWSEPKTISRTGAEGLPPEALRQVFRVDASKLPAFAGADFGKGSYALLKVTKVIEPGEIQPAQRHEITAALDQAAGQEDLSAYLASLRQASKVSVNQELLQQRQ
ncbi:MAG: SurA N-terminal domain-containing protein [Betaproteobacteria bacterium]|nr:SurA N-terminal domain-containing protein [Betaproteobacteria bacterium]